MAASCLRRPRSFNPFNTADFLHLETEQQRLELLRIRATGEIGEPGDGDKDAVHE